MRTPSRAVRHVALVIEKTCCTCMLPSNPSPTMRAREPGERPEASAATSSVVKRKPKSSPKAELDPVALIGLFVATVVALAFIMHDTPLPTILLWATLIYGIVMSLLYVFYIRPVTKVSTN